MFVSNLVNLMIRDATEFAVYGVSPADTTAFKALGDAFEVFPSDIMYLADVSIATEEKNAKVDAIRIGVRSISVRAESKWGANSARYRKFGVLGMNKLTDLNLLNCARRVIRVGRNFLTELASEGLTQQILDDFELLTESFENSLNILEDAISERDIKTEERILKGNELFSFVSKYCNFGKRIWENVNEAKYNDYVIYPSTTQMPGKVLNMGYDVPTRTVSWSVAAYADDYQLERKYYTDPDWTVVYEGADTSVVNDPVTAGTWYYRCRGQNTNGYGTWSDELMVLMPV